MERIRLTASEEMSFENVDGRQMPVYTISSSMSSGELKMSISLRPKKKVNCFSGPPSSVSNAPHLPFFSDLNKKKVASFIFFKCQNQNISIFMLKMNKKGASLCFDQIKNKKSGLICFLGNKK